MKPKGAGNLRFEIDMLKKTFMVIGLLVGIGLGASGPSLGPSLL